MIIKSNKITDDRKDRNIIRTKAGDGPTNYLHDKDDFGKYDRKVKNTMETRRYFSTGTMKK